MGEPVNKLTYRKLKREECDKMQEINPRHYIKNAWRMVEGKRQLIEIDYLETDWPDGYERYYDELINIVENNGVAFGAFDDQDKLLGIVSLKREAFGKTAQYVLLDAMFVSYEARGLGIGKTLFQRCVEEARIWQVDKLLICAGSAEDTIAFYKSVGCTEAEEINQKYFDDDPRDIQLEYALKGEK